MRARGSYCTFHLFLPYHIENGIAPCLSDALDGTRFARGADRQQDIFTSVRTL
jgi:hypothetical protein